MYITKYWFSALLSTCCLISAHNNSYAEITPHLHASMQQGLPSSPALLPPSIEMTASRSDAAEVEQSQEHARQHGAQIHTSTWFDQRWSADAKGNEIWQTELESWIGPDEQKLYLKLNTEKALADAIEGQAKLMYSRMVSDFWDVQLGAQYRHTKPLQMMDDIRSKNKLDAVVGIHGLAPYFFETEAYLSFGENQRVNLALQTSRDLLLTQKWILSPYLELDVMLNDQSVAAPFTGFTAVVAGLQTRYEINKQLMPYVDISQRYEKSAVDEGSNIEYLSQQAWWYGAGLKLRF